MRNKKRQVIRSSAREGVAGGGGLLAPRGCLVGSDLMSFVGLLGRGLRLVPLGGMASPACDCAHRKVAL